LLATGRRGSGFGGGEFLGSVRGLWVVSCGQFGFHGEAAHLPRKRGCSVEETHHCTTQAPHSAAPTAYATGSVTPTGPFRRWCSGCMPFPGDCISQARNGRGIKETAFKPPGKQPVGLLGACVLNLCQWHGAGRAKWPFLRCGTPFPGDCCCISQARNGRGMKV
jgi:hypothetical protein